jgi:hypothetical protein
MGAPESLRYLAMPRHARSREAPLDAHPADPPSAPSARIQKPWVPIVLGAEHRSGWEPPWTPARDAASGARESAVGEGGSGAEDAERADQADLLEKLLSGRDRQLRVAVRGR